MYRVVVNGQSYVAPDLATLRQWALEGRITPTTQVWVESAGSYKPASQIPGLESVSPGFSPTVNYPRAYPAAHVPNNLVWAILATIFCCQPLGIVAIVYAAQVDNLASRGEVQRAQDSATKAMNWSIAAFACGLIGSIAWFGLALFAR